MKTKNILRLLEESKKYVLPKKIGNPKVAVIIGSGLNSIKEKIRGPRVIPYGSIPNFKQTTVEGHTGELIFCKLDSVDVVLLNGRIHYYEGYSMQDVTYPVRFLKLLGIETIIMTCAVGAINEKYKVGDIVLIKDHINFTSNNPLIGKHCKEFGERFLDLTDVYDKNLIKKTKKTADKSKIKTHQGTYFAVTGPSYETPAEIAAFKKLGGDVVGMSLVNEAVVAKQMNMKVLALTYVSNKAGGLSDEKLSHKEVLRLGKEAGVFIAKIISGVIREIQ